MLIELYKLSDSSECDYESYVFNMSVGDFITNSYASNIQRMRNEKKEEGIMKFLKKSIDNKQTPFLQPFILHYSGFVNQLDGRHLLDAKQTFTAYIDNQGITDMKKFMFEVIDGNGRLNAMRRLSQSFVDEIEQLKREPQSKKVQNKIYDLKMKNNALRNTNIVVQLYVNLTLEQKTKLFNSVNQGEKMSKGRLKIYDSNKEENIVLNKYIAKADASKLGITITPDLDRITRESDRELFIPAINLISVIRRLCRYCLRYGIINEDRDEFIFDILDFYIINAKCTKFYKKPFLSILGSVVDKAVITNTRDLKPLIIDMLDYDYKKYNNISIQLSTIRKDILNDLF